MMTEWGTFILNGTERVIVTQLVRSPGAYLMEPGDATKQVFTANLMPSRGSWLSSKSTRRASSTPASTASASCRSRPCSARCPRRTSTGFKLAKDTNEELLKLFDNSIFIMNTLEKDRPYLREDEALIEVFKKQRPGEPPTVENARNLLNSLFFDPKRYDLTKVGRYKLNQRLGVDVPEGTRVLDAGHHRPRPEARPAAEDTRRPRGLEGLRGRLDRPLA